LGRLEIAWRSANGESGRLQTQHIWATRSTKEVEVRLLSLPEKASGRHPFLISCQLVNHTDRVVGPLKIVIAKDAAWQRQCPRYCCQWTLVLTVAPSGSAWDV